MGNKEHGQNGTVSQMASERWVTNPVDAAKQNRRQWLEAAARGLLGLGAGLALPALHPLPAGGSSLDEQYIFSAFADGGQPGWRIRSIETVTGPELVPVRPDGRVARHLTVQVQGRGGAMANGYEPLWTLRGLIRPAQHANAAELEELRAKQPPLGRPEATRAALIPIRKSAAWWELRPAARREIFEETSHHNAIGLEYLPAIARRLHHSRELGESFDFLTWFEFAPEHEVAFNALVARLRATPEWKYVDREVDIRLERLVEI